MLLDFKLLMVLHAHVRAEVITDVCVQPTFSAFTALQTYMQSHWIPTYDSDVFPLKVGKGILYNLRYPNHTYCGEATYQRGQKLLAIWNEFHDEYVFFCIDYANFNSIPPIYTALANWSIRRLQEDEDGSDDGCGSDTNQ